MLLEYKTITDKGKADVQGRFTAWDGGDPILKDGGHHDAAAFVCGIVS